MLVNFRCHLEALQSIDGVEQSKDADMSYVLIVPDFRCVLPNLTNQNLLELSTTLFLLFVIAEIIGAWSSNSLSLLGDASSMGVDVSTYICNIYGEWAKAHSQRSTVTSRIVLEVAIPALSTIAMVAVTLYVLIDAVRVLRHPSITNDVNTNYLYGYAAANLIVDAICGYLFSLRVDDVFVETNQVPQLSLDTFVALDQVCGYVGGLLSKCWRCSLIPPFLL